MMNEDKDRDDDTLGDLWFTNWEQQCIQHLEGGPDYEGQVINDRDLATQKAWCCFQNSAASIAQLYKGILYHNKPYTLIIYGFFVWSKCNLVVSILEFPY